MFLSSNCRKPELNAKFKRLQRITRPLDFGKLSEAMRRVAARLIKLRYAKALALPSKIFQPYDMSIIKSKRLDNIKS